MNLGTKPFILCQASENFNYEYLGSDGIPTTENYKLYLQKCAEFKARAKTYAKTNEQLKNSMVHHIKVGYRGTDEEEILLKREEHRAAYEKAFNFKIFDIDSNSKFECFTGKGKCMRIIRELGEKEIPPEFSEEFDKKRSCWYSRYCMLSRFIQAARIIIIKNRFKKNLDILRTLTPQKIAAIESITN